MFERYTEKARRTIFFGRFEAGALGSPFIETEHLLLGLLREDKSLAARVSINAAALIRIRQQIEEHSIRSEKIQATVDLPLSHECKRALAFGAEEAERLRHQHIGTEHLLLGLMREPACFAARLLNERGVALESLRNQVQQHSPYAEATFDWLDRLRRWVKECEANGGISVVQRTRAENGAAEFAIYAVEERMDPFPSEEISSAREPAQIQKRISFIVERMENAIANHEFEKAHFYSTEEKKERENLRSLQEHLNTENVQLPAPALCIEIIRGKLFSAVQQNCDEFLAEGAEQVWLLDPDQKRAYIATKSEGMREFKGEVLRMEKPLVEMDLKEIFKYANSY